jgi:diguanylate cyclase (GGDEF)-like protein/PAS domain S-box-containing protein
VRSDDEIEATMASLLAEHPDAIVFAVQRDDIRPPAPDHPGLTDLVGAWDVIGPVEALDRLHPSSRPLALTALDRIGELRIVHDELFAADGAAVDSYLFDTVAARKLYLGVIVPGADRDPVDDRRPQIEGVPMRVVRLRTDGLGRVVSSDVIDSDRHLAVGRLSIETVHPDDIDQVRSVWASMLANPGVAHRSRYRAKGVGGWTWHEASITSHLDVPGDGTVHLEVIDISPEMAAHDEVRKRERTLHRLAEALPQAVVQLDRDGIAVYTNGRAASLLGSELDGLGPLLENALDDDRPLIEAALTEALAGADHDLEVRLAHPIDDRSIVAEVTLRALTSESGEPDGVMCCVADVTERARAQEHLRHRATYDQLTGVHNRGSALRSLGLALHQRGAGVAVVFVDLDRFKDVNDRLGHQAGDEVLCSVVARLSGAVRGNDVVGRLGGDEFIVICPDVVDLGAARAAAERIAEALTPASTGDDGLHGVRASVGVAWTDRSTSPAELLSRADAAMYESKREGASRVVVADD